MTPGLVLSMRGSKLVHIADAMSRHTHLTACGVLLSGFDWDVAGLLDAEVERLLWGMRLSRGETIHLIVDDTRIDKWARKMFGVSGCWDHKQQRLIHSGMVDTAAAVLRGVAMP